MSPPTLGTRNKRVLVVDDDPAITAGLEAILEEEGWQVHCAETAADACDGAAFSPDVIILDVELPDSSGIDVLKQIKKRWPATPVIMMSGAATIDRAVKVMKLGAETFLQKPFRAEDLLAAMSAASKASRRVLVVEDDPIVAEGLQLMLEDMGFAVFHAATAKSGLEKFAEVSPNVVLLDVDLPDESGIELLKQIKDRVKSTAIIMMSGVSRLADAVASLKFGAATFLEKPFDSATLAAALHEVETAAASGAEPPASTGSVPCAQCGERIDRMFGACPHCHAPLTEFWRQYADQLLDGKYRLLERLGAGGMGEVYKVEHILLHEMRVIKVIRPHISDHSNAQDRFIHEARLATTIKHPNVATLHDFSPLPDGSQYMVWEFIAGQNLAQILRGTGVFAPRDAVRLMIQALEGLEGIHRASVVHRDISPENLMITTEAGEERLKIIDLGIAKQEGRDSPNTQSGVFIGKFRYASPEHLGALREDVHVDGRADLYSIGVVLYELLTGRAPFEGTSPFDYLAYHAQATPLPSREISRVTGSPRLETIIERALQRDRERRYATAREFADELKRIVDSLPDKPLPFQTAPVIAPNDVTTPVATDVPFGTRPHRKKR